MPPSVTYTAVEGLPLVAPGDDIADLIGGALESQGLPLVDGDIVVIAQKIVSKAENRYVDLATVEPSPRAIELARAVGKDPRHVEVVLSESKEIVRYRENVIIVEHRLGFVMANAGIDESNVDPDGAAARVLLLPGDPDGACLSIKASLDARFQVDIGVVINDSFGRAWRNGVVGVALGAAGLPSLHSMIGEPDLFGRAMQVAEVAVADEIAAGASLVMGQGSEGLPVVHVRGFRSTAPRNAAAALLRPRERDLFR